MSRNNETNILCADPAIAQQFSTYFDAVWTHPERRAKVLLSTNTAILTPIDGPGYEPALLNAITHARQRIRVIMYDAKSYKYANAPTGAIYQALANARARGIDVRVLMETSDHDEALNESNRRTGAILSGNGIKVRYDRPDTITHAKLVIADDTVLLGSSNWNAKSLRVNNEINALIATTTVTAAFNEYFETIWHDAR